MEVAVSAPQEHPEPLRRGTPIPLNQLVEETRRGSNIPNHLLQSKLYCKLRSNRVIEADPSELHFSGFELGNTYTKTLNIINISSEVMDIHIISTQTKHFKTTYVKKNRLIPGLAYTLQIKFYPDEWRYFYDSIRVHCKGEDNLLIPVHAYPVINDLHIPPHIGLSAVPLGQSVSRAIPLRCSCPIDFEFQVFILQPHEAFSVTPLSGVIPANGEVKLVVTFRPFQYGTAQVTIQLTVSQFNTKPYLCTITGSSAPNLTLSHLGKQEDAVPSEYHLPPPAAQVPRCKSSKSTKERGRLKALKSLAPVSPGLKPQIDVCTHAGVAKMLMSNKLSPDDLKNAGVTNRKLKEALFMKKVQQNQDSQPKWQVRPSEGPMSEDRRSQILQEREIAINKYKVKRGEMGQDQDFEFGQPKLSSERLLMEAGQVCEGPPPLQFFDSYLLEQRQKGLKRFQQAARKVVIRNRMNRRLACLKKPSSRRAEESSCDFRISPKRVFPFPFPVLCTKDDPLTRSNLATFPMKSTDVTVTTRVPFFSLQAPQHYKLMGYQTVSLREAVSSYIPTTLARPLRTGDRTESLSSKPGAQPPPKEDVKALDDQENKNVEEDVGARGGSSFTFTAPESLVSPVPANPIRIFNPAPGLQSYSRTPKYLECDLDFHFCPVPRYAVPVGSTCEFRRQTFQAKKIFLNRQKVVQEVISWSKYNPDTSKRLPNQPALTCDCALQSSGGRFTDVILTEPPPALTDCTDDLPQQVDQSSEGPRVHLTQEMIRAEFLQWKDPDFSTNHIRGMTVRRTGKPQMEPDLNQMRHRVMTRLRQLNLSARNSPKPGEDLRKTSPTQQE